VAQSSAVYDNDVEALCVAYIVVIKIRFILISNKSTRNAQTHHVFGIDFLWLDMVIAKQQITYHIMTDSTTTTEE